MVLTVKGKVRGLLGGGNLNDDPRFPAIEISGCGSVTGVWFKPSAAPSDCLFAIGAGGNQACTLTGATAGANFAATTADVILGTHTTTDTGLRSGHGGDHARRRSCRQAARQLVLNTRKA